MTTIVLFHHVLGLTPDVVAFANDLRAAGHQVVTPDLFDGSTFTDLQAGLRHVGDMGDATLLERAEQACADLPSDVVYAGFSLGVVAAQHLLHTRPGARGAVFLHSFIAPGQLAGQWPGECPVHVFAMDHDPFFVEDGDLAAAQAWGAEHDNLHIHLYPGHGHLFLEATLPDHDPQVAAQVTDDIVAELSRM